MRPMGIGFRSPREKTPGAYTTFVSIKGINAHKIDDYENLLLSFVTYPILFVFRRMRRVIGFSAH